MRQTTTTPDVPLPPGTSSSGWAEWDNDLRVIYGPERTVGDALVQTSAVQLPDGSLEAKDLLKPGPAINVETFPHRFLSSAEAPRTCCGDPRGRRRGGQVDRAMSGSELLDAALRRLSDQTCDRYSDRIH
jgi:hypothetical protein